MTIGIYAIRSKRNGKVYVGASTNIEGRWSFHRSVLNRGLHHSWHLQRAWERDGADAFEWIILEEVDNKDDLRSAEQKWLDTYQAGDRKYGYNLSSRSAGVERLSEETKHKMSLSQRGENQHNHLVTEDDVIEIRARAADGESYASIADDFPIGPDGVKSIVYKNNWKHVGRHDPVPRDIDGSHHPGAILNEELVAEIKRRLAAGEKQKDIANDLGLRRENVSVIAQNRAWDHVPWPDGFAYPKRHRLTVEEVIDIRARLANGETCSAIGESVGIDSGQISRIATGYAWKNVPWPEGKQRAPARAARGAELPQTKLTVEQVRGIKTKLAEGQSQQEIASEYGVGRGAIKAISEGKTWKWV